jgi:hypothetical protein
MRNDQCVSVVTGKMMKLKCAYGNIANNQVNVLTKTCRQVLTLCEVLYLQSRSALSSLEWQSRCLMCMAQYHRWQLTNCIDEHCKPSESSDCVCEMLLGIVKLFYVPADLLYHHLALLCLAPDLIDLTKELLNLHFGFIQILPVHHQRCWCFIAVFEWRVITMQSRRSVGRHSVI